MFPPGTCQPTARDLARIVPALALHHSPLRLARIARWYGAWLAHDPAIAHWHMGPLAVDPAYRRQGIARRMGEAALRHLTTQPAPAYLETDTEDNVELYQRFGFRVTGEQTVLGIRNWFMQRDA
jgi:GNAT superfamily N-acetyltransferase